MFQLLATAALLCNPIEQQTKNDIDYHVIQIWKTVEEAQDNDLSIDQISEEIKYRLIMIRYNLWYVKE